MRAGAKGQRLVVRAVRIEHRRVGEPAAVAPSASRTEERAGLVTPANSTSSAAHREVSCTGESYRSISST
jgi:hypothetical protein